MRLSIAFNVGAEKFAKSTAIRELNKGRRAEAAHAIMFWNKPESHHHAARGGAGSVPDALSCGAAESSIERQGANPETSGNIRKLTVA